MGIRPQPPRQEFERKFLVLRDLLPDLSEPKRFRQGYLYTSPTQVRIRIVDGKEAYCQIKGAREFESTAMSLPLAEAAYMMEAERASGSIVIVKDHCTVPAGSDGLEWELHVFHEENEGLIIAELETPAKDHPVPAHPPWLGREVTGDPRFKNKVLAFHPFLSWPEEERREVLGLSA